MKKKTDIEYQQGLSNKGNSCYINTAIQTLLSYPNLPEIIISAKEKWEKETTSTSYLVAHSLCELLDLLLKKQAGNSTINIDGAWIKFHGYFKKIKSGDGVIGLQQEDSSYALRILFDLLKMQGCIFHKKTTYYDAVDYLDIHFDARERQENDNNIADYMVGWPSKKQFDQLFEVDNSTIEGIIHPELYAQDVRADNEGKVSYDGINKIIPKARRTEQYCIQKGTDTIVILPQDPGSSYVIPSEVKLTVDDKEDIFVLASFSQKIGDPSSGHYKAYRREGNKWYKIDDSDVTLIGEQDLNTSVLPEQVKTASKTSSFSCARQLVYVRKSVFAAQYALNADLSKKEQNNEEIVPKISEQSKAFNEVVNVLQVKTQETTDIKEQNSVEVSVKVNNLNNLKVTLKKEQDLNPSVLPQEVKHELEILEESSHIPCAKQLVHIEKPVVEAPYGLSADLSKKEQNKEKNLPKMSEQHKAFNEAINVLQVKMRKLKDKKDSNSVRAYATVKNLYNVLKNEGDLYFGLPATNTSYQLFKEHCKAHVNHARLELDKHRGWGKILLNVFAMIITAGIGYAIAAGINIAINKGKFTFFETDSSIKLSQVESYIENNVSIKGG